ncbi:MAG TPA: cysteine desulfurase [Verrucomicrobiota bacterium]|jgi:cysteine desulfurase/selenocysteine lyase|nr:cysteine desulfurase [Verrucomicrobiota bacterium]HRT55368.1 cysteine desulfurase [Candidatus Paceibacterota bacterium]
MSQPAPLTPQTAAASAAEAGPDWNALRADFPILHQQVHNRPLLYLDNAATTQKPRAVIQALQRYYERDNANVHRGIHELSNRATAAFESARARAARFLNARSPEEIVFTRGTTEGINLVAATWGAQNVKAGDIILLTEMEHHSNLVPWQLLAARTGARLRHLPVTGDAGLLDLSHLDEWLGSGVKLLALTHISNSLGTINPVAEICARARKAGVTTLVDAAQSAGHRPVDVQEIGCDFLALSGHKMCGPTGIGVLYGRQELLETLPPYQGGGEMILSVEYHTSTWKHAPHRFEAGTPDISGAVGLAAAMDYLDAIGRTHIARHDQELGAYAYARLAEFKEGIRLFGPRIGRAGLVSFLLRGVHAHDVVTVADQWGVALRGGHHCTQPLMRKLGVESTARASFYFYNTPAEIDRLVEVLREIQKFFGL